MIDSVSGLISSVWALNTSRGTTARSLLVEKMYDSFNSSDWTVGAAVKSVLNVPAVDSQGCGGCRGCGSQGEDVPVDSGLYFRHILFALLVATLTIMCVVLGKADTPYAVSRELEQ